ncbi:MAG TPA: GNAT family N-acetyltransferase [Rhizomicrobium sp.]|nr:GNAT family N-acetyltransferase [Rhizomicrobium sp.]
MVEIRPYRATDLATIYDICLKTGDAGRDATGLYGDPQLLGHVYAAPYGVLAPECCFVAEDAHGVAGYVIGTADTCDFEARLEREWWPPLRARYADPGKAATSPDERMQRLIHRPERTPPRIADPFPGHLHIDLLPRLQGQGLGKRMIDHWRDAIGRPTHLGVGLSNARAVRFYRAYGFREVERYGAPYDVIVFGIASTG